MSALGLRRRATVLAALRTWFANRGFLEVPTPTRVPSPAMEEHLHGLPAGDAWLRTSPEFALKRVLAMGLPRIYEIGPCFRAEESGPWHGTEFLMLEWYRVGAPLSALVDDVESLVKACADALVVAPPEWTHWTVAQAFSNLAHVDLATATATTLSDHADDTWDEAFFRCFLDHVEPRLPPATFLSDWPVSQAALATIRTDAHPRAERFEAYLNGVELANAFHELVDAAEQRTRFEAANHERIALGYEPHPVDEGLIRAVGQMPPTSGIALGVERLVAALCGWDSIHPGRVSNDAD
ncbi:MAG: lysyl-tRNA synthetase class 2 [Myxococcota bacterium]|jgi:lysyl-tRNA synthetase class 2